LIEVLLAAIAVREVVDEAAFGYRVEGAIEEGCAQLDELGTG